MYGRAGCSRIRLRTLLLPCGRNFFDVGLADLRNQSLIANFEHAQGQLGSIGAINHAAGAGG